MSPWIRALIAATVAWAIACNPASGPPEDAPVDGPTTDPGTVGVMGSRVRTDWLSNIRGGDHLTGGCVADANGNLYLTGVFAAETDLDYVQFGRALPDNPPVKLRPLGGDDIFVAKLAPDGRALWARRGGGAVHHDAGHGIAIDPAGNTYVTGSFGGHDSAPGGLGLKARGGGVDIFVAKYSVNGDLLWARSAGGSSDPAATVSPTPEVGVAVAVDARGDVYVTGQYQGPSQFDALSLPGTGMFLAKYSTDGAIRWVTSVDNAWAAAVMIDPSGNVVVAGTLADATLQGSLTTMFGDVPLVTHKQVGFLAMYSPEGKGLRAVAATTPSGVASMLHVASIDHRGDIYVAGTSHPDWAHLWTAKYDSAGTQLWSHVSRNPTAQVGGMAVQQDGSFILTGQFTEQAQFGTISLTGRDSTEPNAFITSYSGTGQPVWATAPGLLPPRKWWSQDRGAMGIAVSGQTLYVMGYFSDRLNVDGTQVTARGSTDTFIWKLSAPL